MEDKELENELYETIRDLRQRIYELEADKEHLQERIDYLLQDREDNYKKISIPEQIGINNNDFI